VLKFIFWFLLGANALAFLLGQGYLGSLNDGEREPARVKNQLNAEKLKLISAASAQAATAPPPPAAASSPQPETFPCTEIGNFVLADARRFEARAALLLLGDRQSRHNVPGQDISSYMVYIPPQGSKEGADKKAGELKQLGVTNYFVISDNSALRWGISLGVFKTETMAQTLLANLNKQGVHSARVSPRFGGSKQVMFQFRDLDAVSKARLDQIKAAFPAQEMHACK
jgi:hypothetical protein